ncbi:MAG TPA: type I DNA topoisomerase [Treponemataceae bacterium]|nr:type I DNA topoisomerase [Treponemataceae bacterium]
MAEAQKETTKKATTKKPVAKKTTTKKTTSRKKSTAKKKQLQTLVIVESPAKAKTIEKYLGRGYLVKASMGHLIDLPKSRIAINVEDNFQPDYITVRGRASILKDLQKEAKKSKKVLLAPDNDREGEAIAWHLHNAIKPKTEAEIKRIVFNEITPLAIKQAVKEPTEIIESLVNAQKARRVLDRLVGYNLSPLLWKKVKNGLSAGRVQSVALRLICEREAEVETFIPEEYWSLKADFKKGRQNMTAQLVQYEDKKPVLKTETDVQDIIKKIENSECFVSDIKTTDRTVKPKAPFTTSKLQQTAANKLGFTSRKTMQIAQQLYEGIAIGRKRVGLITYMRTDSTRISDTALEEVRDWIEKNFPNDLPEKPITYAMGKKAQDAHEAIRPTYIEYTPEYVKEYVSRDQFRLYSIIWEAFVSCQMKNAKNRTTSIEIKAEKALFRMSSREIVDRGFYNVIKLLKNKDDHTKKLPNLVVGEKVITEKLTPEQHFTQGPARFTDASIVKILEEKGIGRPSTYAPIISTLLDRYYVTRNNKQLVPTVLGRIINDILVESFPDVINEHFTVEVENKLDLVEADKIEWSEIIGDFYWPFKNRVDELMENLESVKGKMDEPTDKVCEKCGSPMVKKLGRFGFFLACSNFPECRNTKSIPLAKCPKCKTGDIVARKTKARGKEFYGCTHYPECDFLSHYKPINSNCPKCGWFLVEKYDKKNGNYKCCINKECDYLHSADEIELPDPSELQPLEK